MSARRFHNGSRTPWRALRALLALGAVAVLAAVLFASATGNLAHGAALTWLGGTSTDWNVGANWSSGTAPTSADDVTFTGAVTNCPQVDGAASRAVASVTIAASFTCSTGSPVNTVKENRGITIGTSSSAGTVVDVQGATFDLSSNGQTVNGNVSVSGGTFKTGNGNINSTTGGAAGSVSVTGGTYNPVGGNTVVAGNATANGGAITKSAGNATTAQLVITGTLTLGPTAGSALNATSAGGIVVNGAATVGANSTVSLSSTGAITFNSTVSQTGGTIANTGTGTSSISFNGLYTLNGGTFSTTTANATTNMTAGWTYTSGTVTGTNGTVVFGGSADTVVSLASAVTLKNVSFGTTDGKIVTLQGASGALTATGTTTFNDGLVKKNGASGSLFSQAGVTESCTFDGGDIPWTMNGGAAQVVTGPASCTSDYSLPPLTINKTGNVTTSFNNTVRTSNPVTLTALGTTGATGTFGGSGTLLLAGTSTFTNNLATTKPIVNVQVGDTLGFASSTANITLAGTLAALDTQTSLSLTAGQLNSGTVANTGDLTEGSGFTGGTTAITLNSTNTTQTITGPGSACASCGLPPVTVNQTNTAGIQFSGNVRLTSDFTVTAVGTGGYAGALGSKVIFGAPGTGATANANAVTYAVPAGTGSGLYAAEVAVGTGKALFLPANDSLKVANLLTLTSGSINGGGSGATLGQVSLAGNLTQTTGAEGGSSLIVLDGTGGQTVNGGGSTSAGALPDVNINGGGGETVTLASTIRTARTWQYTAGSIAGSGTLALAGGTLKGTQTVPNLDIESGGGTLSSAAASDVTVTGTLTLNGTLTTNANKAIVATTGSVTRNSGFIQGTERKLFNTGAGQSFTYDIGGTTNYRPLALANLNVTTAGTGLDATVTTSNGQHASIGSSTIDSSKDVQRYWTLTPQGGFGASTYDATFTFLAGDVIGGASTSAFAAGKYNGSWSYPTVGTKTATSTQVTGITSGFGDFVLGEALVGDGAGTMALDRSTFSANAQTGDVTFTYTAAATMTAGTVSVVMPAGWTAPQTGNGANPGYITASTGTPSASGQTVTVTGVTLSASGTLTITYKTPTLPATTGSVTFQTKQSATGGTPLDIATQPTATVYAPDGSGTGTVSPTSATAGTTAALDFTYTAATGGLGGGSVTVEVPAAWTQPQTGTSTNPGYVRASVNGGGFSTANVAVTGSGPWTITVSSVTIAAAQTVVVRYGDTTAAVVQPRAGTASFPVRAKSVSGGTLTTVSTPTVAVSASADGAGSAGVSPGTAVAGSSDNTLLFTYTAAAGGLTGGSVTVAIPSGWTAPQTSSSTTAGYVTASINNTSFTTLNTAVTGTGPWTVTVSGVDLDAGQTVRIRYGETTSGTNPAAAATAPARTETSSFQLQEKSTSGGGLTNVGSAQTVAVGAAADGAGSAGVSPSSVTAGTSGNLLAFTYTAAAGGTSGGAVTLAVPAGWTAPQTSSSSAAGYVTANIAGAGFSTTGVAVTGSGPWTITVSSLDLNAGQTVVIRYGDPGAGSSQVTAPLRAGTGSFQLQEKSTGGGTLANVGAAQTVTVNASANGAGSAVVSPTTLGVSTSTTLNFTYTAVAGGTTGGAVTVQVPSSWSAPQTSLNTTAGYVRASIAGGAFSTSGVAVTGAGPWTVTVSGLDLNAGDTVVVRYGDTSGNASGAAVSPSAGETSSFPVQEKSTSGGTLTTVSTPTVTVTGAPTMQSATITGSTLVITWSQALSTGQAVAGSAFAVDYTSGSAQSAAGTGTVTYPDGTHTQVTLASALRFADAITKVTYTTPGTDPQIRGASPTTASVTHNITTGFTNNTANNGPSTPGSLSPADNFATQSGQPTLQGTYLDADPNDTATAAFNVCSDSSCSTVVRTASNTNVAAGATTSWQVTPSLAQGTWYWRVTTTDSGGASTSSAIRSFVVDQTAPTLPTFTISRTGQSYFDSGTSTYYYSPAAGTQNGTLDISATASDGSGSGIASIFFPAISITGFSGGGNTVNAASGSATTYSFSSSNAAAPADLVVVATDRAGNTSLASAGTVRFVRDVTPPAGGSISVPSAQSSSSVTITTGPFSDAGSQIASNAITRSNAQAPVAGVCPSGSYSGSNPVTSPDTVPGDGCYRYTLTGTDNVGNSATAASSPVLVDSGAPSGTISSGTSGFHKPSQLGTFSGTAADSGSGVASVTLRIHDNTANKEYDGTDFLAGSHTVAATGTTTWSGALDTTKLTAGNSYTVTVSVTDAAGNTTASAATQTFTVDATNPTGTITVPDAGTRSATSALATLSGTAADTGGSGVASVSIRIHDNTTNKDYGNTGLFDSSVTVERSVTGTTSWTYGTAAGWDSTKLVDGNSYTVTLHVTDTAGNGDPSAATRTFMVDNTGPTVVPTIDTFPAASTSSTTADFGFSAASDTDRDHFECRVDAGTWVTCSSPKSYSAVAIGTHQFDLSAVDSAGNRGTIVSKSWTVGAAPLNSPTITGYPVNPSSSPIASFTFSSSQSGVDHFECRLDGGTFTTCSSPKVYTGLSSASHTFDVRAVATGGAPGTTATKTWTVAPYLTSTSPSDGATTSSAPANVTLTANTAVTWASVTVEHEQDGAVSAGTFTGSSTSITIPFTATAAGLYTYTADITAAGQTAHVLTHFTIWVAPATPDPAKAPPPVAKTAPAGSADSLTTSDESATVTWDTDVISSASSSEGVVMHAAPQTTSGGTAFGGSLLAKIEVKATKVQNGVDTGTAIHDLDGVLEIQMKDSTRTAVPGYSTDGTTWTAIPELSGTTLPGSQQDGFYRDASGNIHILTRHLTFFGLSASTSLGPPRSLVGTVQNPATMVLYWEPPAGSPVTAHYYVYKDGVEIAKLGGAEYQYIVPNPVVGDPSVYQVRTDNNTGSTSPLSMKVSGVPDLTGMTVDNAKALLAARGYEPGTITTVVSNEATGTVVGQSRWPLPLYLPLGSKIDLVVAEHGTPAGSSLNMRVAAARRDAVAKRPYLTARIDTTLAGQATIALTRYKSIRNTYATWSKPLAAGANYVTLPLAKKLALPLPGIYRLTVRVKANDQSKLYSIRLYLYPRSTVVALPPRATDLLVVTGPAVNDQVTQLLSGSYSIQTAGPDEVFTALPAPNETVGAAIVDATDGTGTLETIHYLHFLFPDLRIVAVVGSPAASAQAKEVGAAVTVVSAPSPDATSAEITQVLRTTLGR